MPDKKRRVVITGHGMVTPLGGDLETTWAAVREGRSGTRRLTRFAPKAPLSLQRALNGVSQLLELGARRQLFRPGGNS